jgi:hypothetical protein
MTSLTSLICRQIMVLTVSGTGVILPIPYDISHELIPSQTLTFKSMNLNHDWENSLYDNAIYEYQGQELEKIEIIKSFSLKLLSQMKDMDEDLIQASNEVFWDSL